ncbi:MAG TPA: polysaccharide deacetylase family protein [Flavobacteriaceae bacterium]|nr:polysaccharide deacetylase family protein [Flavobacteriaceae bacterium]
MKKYFVKTPYFIKLLLYKYVWHMPKKHNAIYLTFDDGPTPTITPWVLDQLKKYNAKATFFCIGKNIEKYPEIFKQIIAEGHTIGNHTYNHVNATKNTKEVYLNSIKKTEKILYKHLGEENISNTKLFRPPYGVLNFKQANSILKLGYKIIMWDVLSADFDKNAPKEKCLNNVIKNTESGSIIVFHDSDKSADKLKFILPKVLDYYSFKGCSFKSIAQPN